MFVVNSFSTRSMCSCDSDVLRQIGHFLMNDCFVLCSTFIVCRIPSLQTFAITISWSIWTITRERLCHNIDAAAKSSSNFFSNWICFSSATCVCSLTRWWNKLLVMLTPLMSSIVGQQGNINTIFRFVPSCSWKSTGSWSASIFNSHPDDLSPMWIPADPVLLATSPIYLCCENILSFDGVFRYASV